MKCKLRRERKRKRRHRERRENKAHWKEVADAMERLDCVWSDVTRVVPTRYQTVVYAFLYSRKRRSDTGRH